MGTRGFVGVVVDGEAKVAYNHFDSYPSGLGLDTLAYTRNNIQGEADVETTRSLAKLLKPVDPETRPTEADVERLGEYLNTGVGYDGKPGVNWYQLLRGTQGKVFGMLRAGLYEDAGDFPADSLFCEWGYLIDLDAETFEVYEGFQREPHDKGRFAGMDLVSSGYFPVALVASWPLAGLPTDGTFLLALRGRDED
jgi:hypothetical protein